MNAIKQRIIVLTTVMMVFVCSMVSAYGPEFWNGDKNYPRCYGRENVTCYVDLSSAFVAESNYDGKTLKYNVITTYDDSDKTEVDLYTIYLKGTEDGYDRYLVDENGKLHELDPYVGYQASVFRSSVLVSNHLRIKG